jgi:hypothetical protein
VQLIRSPFFRIGKLSITFDFGLFVHPLLAVKLIVYFVIFILVDSPKEHIMLF